MKFKIADFDEEGPLVWKKRYKGYYRHAISIGQKENKHLIEKIARIIFGPTGYLYDDEWADYIPNYFESKKNGEPKSQQVSFDHVIFIHGLIPIIFETDDPSHYDKNYCELKGWNYDERIRKDKIKDEWAKINNIPLIRLRDNMSLDEKKKLIINIFTDVKNSIRS